MKSSFFKQCQWTKVLFLMPVVFIMAVACASSGEKRELSNQEKARLMVNIANGALLEGDPTSALEYLIRAEKIDQTLPELYHSKALALFAKSDRVGAVDAARRAVKLKPDYSEANNTLGKLLLDQNDLTQAEPALSRAANDPLYRDSPKARTNLGILYYRLKRWDEAKRQLDLAVDGNDQTACIAHFYRGNLLFEKGRYRQSLPDYQEATKKLCGNYSDAHFALALAYEKSEKYDDARKKYLEVNQLYPNTEIAQKAMQRLRGLP